ncbi:MAG: alpha/beta hydrolase [Deltaproteobacteria bacterium]|nr:alpha/beta hydrolase [Deltaproteobacteria bacterium]
MTAQFTDRFVTANGLKFHYLDWGSPDKPPMVLLHGVGQTCHTWDLFAAAMSPHFHVMAFDQRGHGDSDWAADRDYSRKSMVKDAEAFTRELGLGQFFLLGMSMGGANSLSFTGNYSDRVKALVVVDVGPRVESTGVQHIRDFMKNFKEFNDLDEAAATIHKFNPRRPLEIIRKYTCVYNLKQLPSGKWTWKYDTYFSEGHSRIDVKQMHDELTADVKKITCPTLVVRGGESDVFSLDGARELQEAIPGSEFALVPKAGHSVMGDNPPGFEAAVRGFYLKNGYLSA